MKKSLIILVLTASLVFTSCDSHNAEDDFVSNIMTSESLMNGATFGQFDLVDGKYIPSQTGNYILYDFPSVSAVDVYFMENGNKKILSYGRASGIVYYKPSRGSDPQQTIYFSYINSDGTEVVAEKKIILNVAKELDPAMKVLVSHVGVKKWKWMPTDVNGGAVWGNGGYLAGEQDGSINIAGAWWGCGPIDGDCIDTFEEHGQYAGKRWPDIKGECYALSYMEFNEDGSLTAYSNEGVKINEGSFNIKDWKDNEITNADKFSRGSLVTSEGAILWPFALNTDGMQPTEFEIGYLDVDRMVLIYAAPGTGSWFESTWWSFMSDDDASGILAAHDWHWKPTEVNGGAVWGVGGYRAGSQDGTGAINGGWWGCGVNDGDCLDKFESQMGHAGPTYIEGEEYSTSRIVFNEDKQSITVYGKDGNELRVGSFSLDMTPNPDHFSIGNLNTSAGAILWPFAINKEGYMPTSFEIGYLGTDAMILFYAPEGTLPWEEATWWSFGK